MTKAENSFGSRERLIPIMPCPDIRIQADFYNELGFEVLRIDKSPAYASLRWKDIEINFWGSRKIVPSENSTMCFLMVKDVEAVNNAFTAALRKYYGKIPRSGFPKITRVRDLVNDRRFTLTDPGGNTLYIGSPLTEANQFFRTLDNKDLAKKFAVLYDILYSKEDPGMAEAMLPKYSAFGDSLQGIDEAKYLLVLADIQRHLGKKIAHGRLAALLDQADTKEEGWKRISKRYLELLKPAQD